MSSKCRIVMEDVVSDVPHVNTISALIADEKYILSVMTISNPVFAARLSFQWLADHQNISCDDYADWLADNDPDDPQVQLNRYLETAGIACPNPECQEVFE